MTETAALAQTQTKSARKKLVSRSIANQPDLIETQFALSGGALMEDYEKGIFDPTEIFAAP